MTPRERPRQNDRAAALAVRLQEAFAAETAARTGVVFLARGGLWRRPADTHFP